jgi:hypothetical protein
LAPVELTDANVLAQSIALPLIEQVLAQASEHHAIGAAGQPLLGGLHLWQVWDLDLPVATYGRERLPALVAGLGHSDSWEELIPAVYGVSVAEFEAGWQAHVAAQHGL